MTPMMMMMIRPVARIKATRAWEQTGFADRGEPTKMSPKGIRDNNAKGNFVKDKNGYVITTYDGLPDSAFDYQSGQYGQQIDDVPWQPLFMDLLTIEEDVCYAFLGVEITRPVYGGHHYKLKVKKHTPGNGCWKNSNFATTYVPWRTYRAATGSNRIEEITEEDGACTVTMVDQADSNRETVTFSTLTDSDDLTNRPSVQTGNVAGKHGTVDTTNSIALKLAGHINEPVSQRVKIGGPVSVSYDPVGVRTRWADGKTWNTPYWATCFFYCTNYYGIEYEVDGELILKAVPIYDYLTKQAGFMDEASDNNRLIFSQGKRPFLPIFDDGFVIEEVNAG